MYKQFESNRKSSEVRERKTEINVRWLVGQLVGWLVGVPQTLLNSPALLLTTSVAQLDKSVPPNAQ